MNDAAAGDTESASVTVRVGRLEVDRSRTETTACEPGFYVENDGTGIPDDEKVSVLDEGDTTANDGTGFGLAIVRDSIRAHGWSIAVTDADDGGARFEITGIDRSALDDLEQP
ncbi:sensor histidine kinase [Natrinema caseinilyticum]|uniref:sensor histidine kinase n=1 Tax=Natrinema caseinilyticum TaxID=2961570 RepID=UPI0020C22A8F|nr:ATP-binding protein [Natrinema caseinilyticum]